MCSHGNRVIHNERNECALSLPTAESGVWKDTFLNMPIAFEGLTPEDICVHMQAESWGLMLRAAEGRT